MRGHLPNQMLFGIEFRSGFNLKTSCITPVPILDGVVFKNLIKYGNWSVIYVPFQRMRVGFTNLTILFVFFCFLVTPNPTLIR